MIVTYRHKGLELYARKGDRSKLPQAHLPRIRMILTMNQPGYHYHALAGDLKGFHSVRVSGNNRIIFRFEDGNVHDVDYLDYH